MNLETSVTSSPRHDPAKGIHYRMSPDNVGCLTAAGVDVWTLANNHVLDFGVPGLLETLEVLRGAGQRLVGAGADRAGAWQPAVVERDGVLAVVAGVAHPSSGVPRSWAATGRRPGVALLPDLSEATAVALADRTRLAGAGALRVVSIHWGGNWGYQVPAEHRRFAHALVDAGVHVVHGHSSHHPRPVEVYRDALVLYGCGDLVNDYEGIAGYDRFRDDLRLLYVADFDHGALRALSMPVFQARRLSLWRAHEADVGWLARTLEAAGGRCGPSVVGRGDRCVVHLPLRPPEAGAVGAPRRRERPSR